MTLKEKFLKQLREKSSVKINKEQWTKLKKSITNKDSKLKK